MGFLSVAMLLASIASAETDFNKACGEIVSCAEHVAGLLGHRYLMDNDVKGSAKAVGNLAIDKDNADLLFSKMLYLNGFTRVPLGPRNTFEIRRIRDAKDSALPRYAADARHGPSLPKTWDLVFLSYKATHPESLSLIRKLLMNIISPTVRIFSSSLSGTISVVAPAAELQGLYETIKENDVKPSALALREEERLEERQRAAEAKKP